MEAFQRCTSDTINKRTCKHHLQSLRHDIQFWHIQSCMFILMLPLETATLRNCWSAMGDFAAQFYTAVAQSPSASCPSNAWQWSLGGASRYMRVTLVGRQSNSTKHSLRLTGHQHIAHHTHRVVLCQLFGAQPAKSTHNLRYMVKSSLSAHNWCTKVNYLLYALNHPRGHLVELFQYHLVCSCHAICFTNVLLRNFRTCIFFRTKVARGDVTKLAISQKLFVWIGFFWYQTT